ncbi:MAG: MoaD family protein [Candidatus Brockarchaeota archaeon]|nr:MoaD family protein [Candidatus Brockarchaeota archaeon]MBO3842479.1 MoaD family protein [Candidatus Brockarchaeota archaeon]
MGKVNVALFGNLAKIAGEKTTLVDASTLGEVLNALVERYGEAFRNRIYDENNRPRRFINIYVNGKDVRFLDGLETKLNDSDKVFMVPAVGGG